MRQKRVKVRRKEEKKNIVNQKYKNVHKDCLLHNFYKSNIKRIYTHTKNAVFEWQRCRASKNTRSLKTKIKMVSERTWAII